MDLKELQETDTWVLYSQGENFLRMNNVYEQTDKNFRFFNGDQNKGIKIEGIEPIQLNYIKPIVRYKVGVSIQYLWQIVYSSENFENIEFKETADETCKLLNRRVARIWEKENMDKKMQKIIKNSAINGECVAYITYDEERKVPKVKILSKVDVYYGNENNDEIEEQPYIIIKQRMPVINARELAKSYGYSNVEDINGDLETAEESGDDAKYEKDEMVTILTKFYKKDGKVYFTKSTRYFEIKGETNTGLKHYPVIHLIWEEKEGSARGVGEVEGNIPNQLEVNKTLMRRALVIKMVSYPTKVVAIDKIANPSALNKLGGLIKVNGNSVEDVQKIFTNIQPAQMSSDVQALMNDLINVSRELANASDIASGSLNNSTMQNASGRAILAVQQAAQQPLKEQNGNIRYFIECFARVLLDYIKVYSKNGLILEKEITGENGETQIQPKQISATTLENLQADVKVDVTPKGAYDKFAQEQSLENLLMQGMFNVQRLPELKVYLETLDDDSSMPKQRIKKAIKKMEEEQQRIALINAQAQIMQNNANAFLNSDSDSQASQLVNAENMINEEIA